MKEFITANGNIFECTNISTGINSITFTMQDQDASDLEPFFRGVSELTVTFEGQENPHGIYENLAFESITIYADTSVSVSMHIGNGI